MRILVQVLLTFLVLSACLGDVVSPWTDILHTNMLKESMRLLDPLPHTEVSCNKMNVTNIFADDKTGNNTKILCKAATIAREGQSCHRDLESVYHNLLSLAGESRAGHKQPCPVVAGSTTSLKNFLQELYRKLQEILKEEYKTQK